MHLHRLVVGFVASINLAVPLLAAGSLHPSSAQLLWIVDAYVVLFACLVIPGGAVGDRFGRKGVLLAGLLVFAVGAAVSAGAPDIAVWAAMSGVGGVIGNVGGGAVLTTGSWRWLFIAAVPIALACLVWVAVSAPTTTRHLRHLDPVAALLLTAATVALLVGIIGGPQDGWDSPTVVAGFAAAVVLSVGWVLTELRAAQPLLDPRLFAIPTLRAACLGMVVSFFGLFALFYLKASFLQYGKGFSVLQTGLGVIPVSVPLLVGARFVPALSARLGAPVTLAAAFACIGTVLTSRFVAGLREQVRSGGSTPRTVAAALHAAGSPATRAEVLNAFVASADTSLRVIGVSTLLAGVLITAQSARSARVGRA